MKRVVAIGVAIDAVVVLVFSAVGRRSHDESNGIAGVLGTAAPFLGGLAIAWAIAAIVQRRRGRDLDELIGVDRGVILALATVGIGMALRRFAWDRGTALAFVIVTAVFVTFFCAGWRAVWNRLELRRSNHHASTRSSAG